MPRTSERNKEDSKANPRPMPRIWSSVYSGLDEFRRAQGRMFGLLGYGPVESAYRIVASTSRWRLREYAEAGSGPVLLIIAAPIKQPYIWDLAPSISALKLLSRHNTRIFLLEWTEPKDGAKNVGLEEYACRFIRAALERVLELTDGKSPFLVGHSLGGTLAAIFAATQPAEVAGLVVLSSPLCFAPGTGQFRDALVSMARLIPTEIGILPGTLLTQLSALADPTSFVWSRLTDAALGPQDEAARQTRARIERWTLDEFPLSGRLVQDVLHALFEEDCFCQGQLVIDGKEVGPKGLRIPTLIVVNTKDDVASARSVRQFVDAVDPKVVQLIEYDGDEGVGLQHLGILVGQNARVSVWPQIISWLKKVDRGQAPFSDRSMSQNSPGPDHSGRSAGARGHRQRGNRQAAGGEQGRKGPVSGSRDRNR